MPAAARLASKAMGIHTHIDDPVSTQDVERAWHPKLEENPPQFQDTDLDRTGHRFRGAVSPDELGRAAGENDLIGVQQQEREEGTLLRRAELNARAVGDDLEGPPDSEFRQMVPADPLAQHGRRGSTAVSLSNRPATAGGTLTVRVPHVHPARVQDAVK